MYDIAIRSPLWLSDIRMRLAVPANDAVRTDQNGCVVIEVARRIDFRHADDDIAAVLVGNRMENIGGRPGDGLDERFHLSPVEPAIAGRSHFGRDDQARPRLRGLLAKGRQPADIARLFEHGRFELDSSGGVALCGCHDCSHCLCERSAFFRRPYGGERVRRRACRWRLPQPRRLFRAWRSGGTPGAQMRRFARRG
ncbi:hypothetical protein D3C71_1067300 [compost metagenome]